MGEEYQKKLFELLKLCIDLNSDGFAVDYHLSGHATQTVSVTVIKVGFRVSLSEMIFLEREHDSDVNEVITKLKQHHWDWTYSSAHEENKD